MIGLSVITSNLSETKSQETTRKQQIACVLLPSFQLFSPPSQQAAHIETVSTVKYPRVISSESSSAWVFGASY
jgi:hypothetical protein